MTNEKTIIGANPITGKVMTKRFSILTPTDDRHIAST